MKLTTVFIALASVLTSVACSTTSGRGPATAGMEITQMPGFVNNAKVFRIKDMENNVVCYGDVASEEAQHVAGAVDLVEHHPAVDVLDLVQPKCQRRDNAEVSTATPQSPKEIGVLIFARANGFAVGGHHVCSDEVVARQTAAAREVTDATSKREARHTGRGDDAARRRETERIGRVVEVPPRRTSSHRCRRRSRVDADIAHRAQIDDDSLVDRAKPRHAVRATPDREV